jgi:hypothetical protein
MNRTDRRPAAWGADELRARTDAPTGPIDVVSNDYVVSKDFLARTRELQRSLDKARRQARVRTLGAILTSLLFASTLGTWLTFPSDGSPATEVNAWGIAGILNNGVSGRLGVCLSMLMLTILLGILASVSVGFTSCVLTAISGVVLFASEVFLQLGIDSQIALGSLSSHIPENGGTGTQTEAAHLGSGYPFVYVATAALVIWTFWAMVHANHAAKE